jgi:di/tricarboxylate transporter
MQEAHQVFILLGLTLVLFIWGRFRYDIIAVIALTALVLLKIVEPQHAFLGFGHPAVITVASVLIISRALRNSGIVDLIARKLMPFTVSTPMHIAVLTLTVMVCSAFMNNVGALALMLPVALHTAAARNRSPSILLMPLAFGSILGGLMTMMGTPPNIIIATIRADMGDQPEPFSMFDFTPVGAAVAFVGVAFVALFGWRLIPRGRRSSGSAESRFEIKEYILEVRVSESSPLVHQRLGKAEELTGDEVVVIGLVRNKETEIRPSHRSILRVDDILILKADPKALKEVVEENGLEILTASSRSLKELESRNVEMLEAVVSPGSRLVGQPGIYLRRFSGQRMSLLAIARQGHAIRTRLRRQPLQAGDVCLIQAEEEGLSETMQELKLLPLAERELSIHGPTQIIPALGIFAGALAVSAFGWMSITTAFICAILLYLLFGMLPVRDLYKEIDWPVITLLGCMIPVGGALESSGGSSMVAAGIVGLTDGLPAAIVLTLVLVVTMTLSDVINNAATAVVMAPIAVGIAQSLNVNIDPFLMAVALGASCAFLTPIGHQSNTLVLGPGGYRFSDYWRMGLPLEMLIVAVGVPVILWTWPLN